MNAYLQQVSRSLAELSRFSAVNIVMGNESCDLDSTISALVYAYLLYSEMSVDAKETVTVIPLLKILKKEFPLKTEVTYYLKKNGIPMDLLVFWDSINLKELQMTSRLKLTLVDHHVLSPEAEFLCSSVVEVIDHHPQDPAWLWPMQKGPSFWTQRVSRRLQVEPLSLTLKWQWNLRTGVLIQQEERNYFRNCWLLAVTLATSHQVSYWKKT
ncbi:hypothetical protein B7P43_G18096 [Cryptotermes secundus]|uniref:DDH domain-containing protein n=1 Tax=Cryptotermes secundus TaxID=105785 RepID=A0A2J7QVJ6_9NEOP|nr:hypothetical protein B7P43_G18096 [Cryptotermes secundus]